MPKDSNKPRGRTSAYAFFVKACREQMKQEYPEMKVEFGVFAQTCAEKWKVLPEDVKNNFRQLGAADKQRYDVEMRNYVPVEKKGRRRRLPRDPNRPKRALSAFFWFCNDERPKARVLFPDYGVGELAKILGKRWGEADVETRQKYQAMALQDSSRYEQQMSEYRASLQLESASFSVESSQVEF